MTARELQKAIMEDLRELFATDQFKTPDGKMASPGLYPQFLPQLESDDDTDPFPYIIVRIDSGGIETQTDPHKISVILVREALAGGGGLLLLLLTLVEIAPIKVNPWSALAKALGRAINADVLKELGAVKQGLADHIRMDDERNADEHRARILRFNNELLRDIPHTKEEFIDILADIDYYERYCDEHKGYKNNRASHAIANISRVYDDRLREHDFLASSSNERDTEDTLDT